MPDFGVIVWLLLVKFVFKPVADVIVPVVEAAVAETGKGVAEDVSGFVSLLPSAGLFVILAVRLFCVVVNWILARRP